jgi:hypothetical protein
LRALTLTQPWATLIAIGAKRFETRSWSTPYRGRLAIHAGKGLNPVGGVRGLEDLCAREPFRSALFGEDLYRDPSELPRGIIVAEADLVGCAEVCGYPIEPGGLGVVGAEYERDFGDFTPGRFAWVLRNVGRNETPPVRGALGLWTPPCTSTSPFARTFCEKPNGHDGLHEADGKTWNWGDS